MKQVSPTKQNIQDNNITGQKNLRHDDKAEFYKSLKTNLEPWKVIEESFQFLLDNELKESILSEFNISVISHYFPNYLPSLKTRLVKINKIKPKRSSAGAEWDGADTE